MRADLLLRPFRAHLVRLLLFMTASRPQLDPRHRPPFRDRHSCESGSSSPRGARRATQQCFGPQSAVRVFIHLLALPLTLCLRSITADWSTQAHFSPPAGDQPGPTPSSARVPTAEFAREQTAALHQAPTTLALLRSKRRPLAESLSLLFVSSDISAGISADERASSWARWTAPSRRSSTLLPTVRHLLRLLIIQGIWISSIQALT